MNREKNQINESLLIEILSKNDNGFVLMVEGSQIDWAAHDKDAPNIISEMLDFDDAIGAALDFAQSEGRTLIVATADHEAGSHAAAAGIGDLARYLVPDPHLSVVAVGELPGGDVGLVVLQLLAEFLGVVGLGHQLADQRQQFGHAARIESPLQVTQDMLQYIDMASTTDTPRQCRHQLAQVVPGQQPEILPREVRQQSAQTLASSQETVHEQIVWHVWKSVRS